MIVFVHGVPETDRLWDKVRSELSDRESVAVQLPGFGIPRPFGFGATKDDYADWLIGELGAIGDGVDLVGHDWGALITYRVATTAGERLRSWAADVAGLMHPDYVWHEMAQALQSAGGEAFAEARLGQPVEVFATRLASLGLSDEDATQMATGQDRTMVGCMLDLYRSATPNPYADWGSDLGATTTPGLVIVATEDQFVDETSAVEVANILGARVVHFAGVGHFWPLQDPHRTAGALIEFWDSIPPP